MKTILVRVTVVLTALFFVLAHASGQVLSPIYNSTDTNDLKAGTGQGLLLSGDILYGTVYGGTTGDSRAGAASGGAIFKINTDGVGFTNLYVFEGADSRAGLTNDFGASPSGPLVLSGNTLYGVTQFGCTNGNGAVFAINTDGTGFTNLHVFGASSGLTNADGARPTGGLVLSGSTLYGTTSLGGNSGAGTVFAIQTDGTEMTNFYNFSVISSTGTNSDGFGTKSGLVLSNGVLYGTSLGGGDSGFGTVFAVRADGMGFTNLHSFSALVRMTNPPFVFTNADGLNPGVRLVFSGNKLYGETTLGGLNTNVESDAGGTVFSMNTDGTDFTTLHNFGKADGTSPQSLVLADGRLYGTTLAGGNFDEGVVFSMNTDGTGFSIPIMFTANGYNSALNIYTNTSGTSPLSDLIVSGSALYGSTKGGGANALGVIFAVDLDAVAPPVQFTATPSNLPIRLAVQFNSSSNDEAGNSIIAWNWNFGDGSNSVSTVQNPTHAYTNAGTFSPTLTCLNFNGDTVVGSGPQITVSPPLPIQFTASPSNGLPPVKVQFEAPAVDAESNLIATWSWNFGDGSNSVSTLENPTHTYTNSGTYFPTLRCSNYYGDVSVGYGPEIVVISTLLANGGFETGNLNNWTIDGPRGTRATTGASFAHSGKYGAELVAPTLAGDMGFLSQTFPTIPGTAYSLSFWLNNTSIASSNDLEVSWDGNVILDEQNIGNVGWTNFQLNVTAAATNSTLEFGYLTGVLYFGLDDVILSAISGGGSAPRPRLGGITVAGGNLVLDGVNGASGQTYYVLMSTNLTEPFAQWIPVATNVPSADGNFSATVTNALSGNVRQQFYILQSH